MLISTMTKGLNEWAGETTLPCCRIPPTLSRFPALEQAEHSSPLLSVGCVDTFIPKSTVHKTWGGRLTGGGEPARWPRWAPEVVGHTDRCAPIGHHETVPNLWSFLPNTHKPNGLVNKTPDKPHHRKILWCHSPVLLWTIKAIRGKEKCETLLQPRGDQNCVTAEWDPGTRKDDGELRSLGGINAASQVKHSSVISRL